MFELFKTFISVYEAKNFTVAANQLLVAQSTITKRLKRLESDLDITLFRREISKDVIPTTAAHELYPIAINFVESWKTTQNSFKHKSQKTIFKIGITQSNAILLLPNLIKILEEDLTNIELKINIYDSKKILSLVKSKNLNLGVLDQDFSDPQITKIPLFKDHLVLAGDLNSDVFFLREIKHEIGDLAKKILTINNFYFKEIVSINDYGTIINFVENKKGVALLPRKLVPKNTPFNELNENYLLHYSFIHHYNESNEIINKVMFKIKENILSFTDEI